MSKQDGSHRTQIIVAVIGLIGAIATAYISSMNWGAGSTTPPLPPESQTQNDSLTGFYVRDGLANSPVMKITRIGNNEYTLEVTNHPWPWEATVRLSGINLSGYGRFPNSRATMDFKAVVNGDGSISSEYHFITKGDGSPADGRIDRHIWQKR